MNGPRSEDRARTQVIRSRRAVLETGVRAASVHIEGERIASIDPYEAPAPAGAKVIDLGELALLPGLVDPHVHVNEPGRTEWEGFESATRAAAAGGVTTIVDMPLNSSPVTCDLEALEAKRAALRTKLWVDCGLHAGLIPANAHTLTPLLEAGVLACKAFLIDSGIPEFPPADEPTLAVGMRALARKGLRLFAHAEIALPGAPPPPTDPAARRSYRAWLASRPPAWEQHAIDRLTELALETGAAFHIVHVSSVEALSAIGRARARGIEVSAETCPHYLCFDAESIPDGAPQYKCAPPVRERRHREALWRALEEGTLQAVASDHSPAPPALKRLEDGDLFAAWGGIASLELGLRAVWTEARRRGIGLERLVRWFAEYPARLVGLEHRKGRIAPGFDADLIAFDPAHEERIEPERLEQRHPVTPYAGMTLSGRIERTWLRGALVYDRGRVVGAPRGRLLERADRPERC